MTRKQLEIDLAYADRERQMAVGKPGNEFLAAGPTGKVLSVEAVDRPEWLGDGKLITDGPKTANVLIGNARVCLIGTGGRVEVADTSVLLARWASAEGQALSAPL